jgi:hypothetical protein
VSQKSFPTGVVALSILTILMLVGIGGMFFSVSPWGTILFYGVVFIMISMVLLAWMLRRQETVRDTAAYQRIRNNLTGDKIKRGDSLAELMSVLSDDDLEELREHIKYRLMDQADAGDDDDFETFEALLADVQAKRKRG